MTEITDEMARAFDRARWDHCDQQGGDDCCTQAGLSAVAPLIAATERRRIQEVLTGPLLNALRCVPDGRIQNGCVVVDGATVRERLRQAYLAAFPRPEPQENPNA